MTLGEKVTQRLREFCGAITAEDAGKIVDEELARYGAVFFPSLNVDYAMLRERMLQELDERKEEFHALFANETGINKS